MRIKGVDLCKVSSVASSRGSKVERYLLSRDPTELGVRDQEGVDPDFMELRVS